jgi:hypothetical protein
MALAPLSHSLRTLKPSNSSRDTSRARGHHACVPVGAGTTYSIVNARFVYSK